MYNVNNQRLQEAYNEARQRVENWLNYKGDRRRLSYRNLCRDIDLWIDRMDNFAKKLGQPTFVEIWEHKF